MEAAGAAATAGLAAGAIDGSSAPPHGLTHAASCANCGGALSGPFCHACGQPAHISRTLHDVWHDALHGVLHFDTKAWRTLPLLFFRPGTLTHRYIHGQRARFVGPVALFLFTVFLMFFVFAVIGGIGERTPAPLTPEQRADQMALVERAAAYVSAREAEAQSEGDADALEDLAGARRFLDRALDAGEVPPGLVITEGADGGFEITYEIGVGRSLDPIFAEIRAAQTEGRIRVNTGNPSWDEKIKKKLADPEFAWYKIQNTAYKFAFLLVPMSLPFVWFAFLWKRNVTLFDHSVFVLYSQSFVWLLFIISVLLALLPFEPVAAALGALWLVPPVHMFFQLKGGYGLSWWSAIWRTAYLVMSAVFVVALFVAAIFLMGLLG
jgi:hypothetical protein